VTLPELHDETQELATRFMKVFEATFKHLSKHQSQQYNPVFRELNGNQFRAMHLLHTSPGMIQKDLAEQLEVTPAAISTTVRQMERFGLVQRRPDTVDARLMRLYLSEEAQKVIHEMTTNRWHVVAKLLEGLPLPEQRMVVEALERALAARLPSDDHCDHKT
jgi:MarR family transcriptional regulator, organic hydroperoxide resistance regulator